MDVRKRTHGRTRGPAITSVSLVHSRALANCAEGVIEDGVGDVAAQVAHKDVEVVACVLLVVVG